MKKDFLFFVLSFFFALSIFQSNELQAQCPASETKVRIIIRTDSYGYETFWQLRNANNNQVLKSGGNANIFPGGTQVGAVGDPGAYPNNATRRDSICVADYSALKFMIFDDYADGFTGNGYYQLEVNGIEIAKKSSFTAKDSVLFSVPLPETDLAVSNVKFGNKATVGAHAIEGQVTNSGVTPIASFYLNWTIDNGSVRSELYDNLNFAPNQTLKFRHKFGWQAAIAGEYNLKVWISNVNGVDADEFSANNTNEKIITIFQNNRVVLLESFTNASCGPCAQYMPAVEEKLAHTNNYVVSVSYHSDFPGYDVMNVHNPQQSELRGNYYAINSYPSWAIDGRKVANFVTDQALYDSSLVMPTFNIIEPKIWISNDTVYASAEATAISAIAGNFRGHAVVVEKTMDFTGLSSPGTNGMKRFDWVMKQMLTGTGGVSLGTALVGGQSVTLEGSWKMQNVQNVDELAVVFWVQNNAGKKVQNAAIATLKSEPDFTVPVDTQLSVINSKNNSLLKVYPNPASDKLYVVLENIAEEKIDISITNLLGQQLSVLSINRLSDNELIYINTADFEKGLYILQIQSENFKATSRFLINK